MAETKAGWPPFVYFLVILAGVVLGVNGWMVFKSSGMHEDMVRDDYYAASLKHDRLLQAQHRLDSLAVGVEFRLFENQAIVKWQRLDSIPLQASLTEKLHCEAVFYRADNRQWDQTIPLLLDSSHTETWLGSPVALRPGPWQVSVRWYLDSLLYLEKPFKYSS